MRGALLPIGSTVHKALPVDSILVPPALTPRGPRGTRPLIHAGGSLCQLGRRAILIRMAWSGNHSPGFTRAQGRPAREGSTGPALPERPSKFPRWEPSLCLSIMAPWDPRPPCFHGKRRRLPGGGWGGPWRPPGPETTGRAGPLPRSRWARRRLSGSSHPSPPLARVPHRGWNDAVPPTTPPSVWSQAPRTLFRARNCWTCRVRSIFVLSSMARSRRGAASARRPARWYTSERSASTRGT